jgi:hypothetical protein
MDGNRAHEIIDDARLMLATVSCQRMACHEINKVIGDVQDTMTSPGFREQKQIFD